jgi:YebC/PmpR family DNA-binding regulatory protein
MSGHSKWATIKRKKGALDAKRGKLFTKLIKEITVAARMGGGSDPNGNPRLRKAISDAKGQAMPADTIKRAALRGAGEEEGVNYDEVTYEGRGPGGTLFMCEAMTDNRNRTVAEIRKIFERHNGELGASGVASWAFERKGIIGIAKEAATEDQLMEVAVGNGADDYTDQGEEWQVLTPPGDLDAVVKALEDGKIPVKSNSLGSVPKIKKQLVGREAELALSLVDTLDDHDDIQNVYADFDISDEELAKMDA